MDFSLKNLEIDFSDGKIFLFLEKYRRIFKHLILNDNN